MPPPLLTKPPPVTLSPTRFGLINLPIIYKGYLRITISYEVDNVLYRRRYNAQATFTKNYNQLVAIEPRFVIRQILQHALGQNDTSPNVQVYSYRNHTEERRDEVIGFCTDVHGVYSVYDANDEDIFNLWQNRRARLNTMLGKVSAIDIKYNHEDKEVAEKWADDLTRVDDGHIYIPSVCSHIVDSSHAGTWCLTLFSNSFSKCNGNNSPKTSRVSPKPG